MKVALSSGNGGDVPFFKRAVAIDPKFAMAYAIIDSNRDQLARFIAKGRATDAPHRFQRKTVTASSNETPCFAALASAFRGS